MSQFSIDPFHNDWDRKIERQSNRIFGLAVVAWVVGSIVSLAITVGIVIVAIHFLSKVW